MQLITRIYLKNKDLNQEIEQLLTVDTDLKLTEALPAILETKMLLLMSTKMSLMKKRSTSMQEIVRFTDRKQVTENLHKITTQES